VKNVIAGKYKPNAVTNTHIAAAMKANYDHLCTVRKEMRELDTPEYLKKYPEGVFTPIPRTGFRSENKL